ncbi:MAG: hypothetical protein M0T80_14600 [Actinomycetota bacterium]|nr:hypothetical protein [Actinomycetota bacterium]
MGASVLGIAIAVVPLAVLVAGVARRVLHGTRSPEVPVAARAPIGPTAPREPLIGRPAPLVEGVDLSGQPARADLSGRVLLAFLTGSCEPCQRFWSGLAEGRDPGAAVVVVTPSPSTESPRALGRLAGPATPVVMGSEVWIAYEALVAPWFVLVDGGLVLAEGRAESWEQLASLVGTPLAP